MLGQSDMSFMLFYPKLDGLSALSDVHFAADAGELPKKEQITYIMIISHK